MRLITLIRVHGNVTQLAQPGKTVVKTDNQDHVIDDITKKYPECMINVETMYDDKSGVLFDVIYIQTDIEGGSPYDDDDDDDQDGGDNSDILNILRGGKRP